MNIIMHYAGESSSTVSSIDSTPMKINHKDGEFMHAHLHLIAKIIIGKSDTPGCKRHLFDDPPINNLPTMKIKTTGELIIYAYRHRSDRRDSKHQNEQEAANRKPLKGMPLHARES